MHKSGSIVVITGPSGGGKTTLAGLLVAGHPHITKVVTCTTRPPRPGEVNGEDYIFLSHEEFSDRLAKGEFLEHATVYGQSYGTLKQSILDKTSKGHIALMVMDIQGARFIKKQNICPTVVVFLSVDIEVLKDRLTKRGKDEAITINRRLSIAKQEMETAHEFDHILHSGTPAEDFRQIEALLQLK
jgi:guanylate kinase